MILDPATYEPEPAPTSVRQVRGHVVLPDGTRVDNALAIVTTARVYVCVRGPGGATVVRWVAEHDGADATLAAVKKGTVLPSAPLLVPLTDQAGFVALHKAPGSCGCSSRAPQLPPWTPDRVGT